MKLVLLLSILFIVTSCAEPESGSTQGSQDGGIIGGKELSINDAVSPYAVMIFNPVGNLVCTGTIIREDVILTAAHCLSEKPDGLKLIFGVAPMTGKYVSRKSVSLIRHSSFNAATRAHDIALITFAGGLPKGYKPVTIAPENFPLKRGYQLTAVGYGRTTGKNPPSKEDKQGMARLRSVHLTVEALTEDGHYFLVNQTQGTGVCNGDSGGPGLMRYHDVNYVVGVVSSVVWTGEAKDGDTCSERARYMRVSGYTDWISKTLKNLVQ